MTKTELQSQIIFLVGELQRLRKGYNKLSEEAFNDRTNKLKFYEMWIKADERAGRYGGLLVAIYQIIHTKEDDVDYYDAIHQLIDDWYDEEIIKYGEENITQRKPF